MRDPPLVKALTLEKRGRRFSRNDAFVSQLRLSLLALVESHAAATPSLLSRVREAYLAA
jgi:hypothetical protein